MTTRGCGLRRGEERTVTAVLRLVPDVGAGR